LLFISLLECLFIDSTPAYCCGLPSINLVDIADNTKLSGEYNKLRDIDFTSENVRMNPTYNNNMFESESIDIVTKSLEKYISEGKTNYDHVRKTMQRISYSDEKAKIAMDTAYKIEKFFPGILSTNTNIILTKEVVEVVDSLNNVKYTDYIPKEEVSSAVKYLEKHPCEKTLKENLDLLT
jgi:hypothetical protein